MPDLIKKYFQSELSLEEDEVLSKLLSTSEDAAEEFALKAEQAYFELGLPEPIIPQPVNKTLKWSGGRFLKIVLALVSVAAIYWWLRPVKPVMLSKEELNLPINTQIPNVKNLVPVKVIGPPPNPDFDTDYRNLSVIVNLDKESPIVVRIIGPDGLEVRRLYQGPLKAGQWSFVWNGLLDNGQPAIPGTYKIFVDSSAGSKSKEVTIHQK
jgi:hypothetical protein